ncbi:hypothetical protein WA1_38015 [Scytonema hofmannii PCC 7110]|uniref:Uncharacterized protein n=2 Tax=Scytonema hofmannii TaxID=34078 RepID=A0A139X0A8_9CYAN|nr:hypothetical protein WA1_38015 [Scytonema hofmannii PCC 7110]
MFIYDERGSEVELGKKNGAAFIGHTIPNTDGKVVFKAAPFFKAWSPGQQPDCLSLCWGDDPPSPQLLK